jgi:hypothetical protein
LDRASPPRSRFWPLILLAVVVLYFLYNCSGIVFPMWNPGDDLKSVLSRDLRLQLPASARVPHGAREAQLDDTRYFVIEMTTADAAAFIPKVEAMAGEASDHNVQLLTKRCPDWWQPKVLPNVKVLDVHRDVAEYLWFYSDASPGTIYVLRASY